MSEAFTVGWTSMSEGTADDYVRLDRLYRDHTRGTLVGNLLATFRLLEGPNLGYRIDRARHSRQSATRALRNGESSEFVVAALLHDIGDVLAPDDHSAVAAAILAPYVSDETVWVVRHHGVFQGYYYFHHLGGDRDSRDRYATSPYYDRCIDFCASYDQNCFDPHYDDLPLDDFVPLVEEVFARSPRGTAPDATPPGAGRTRFRPSTCDAAGNGHMRRRTCWLCCIARPCSPEPLRRDPSPTLS